MKKDKLDVAILGATGMVGQRMVALLEPHPWFNVSFVGASPKSVGKSYAQATPWRLEANIPNAVAELVVNECSPDQLPPGIAVVFSALDSAVAGEVESQFRDAGYIVISNAGAHRMAEDVPLIIPEVNPQHLLHGRRQDGGTIITNPNCCAIPLTLSLAPLEERWGIEAVVVSTWQAVSGAGYPGESAWDMVGNVHPHAGNEEQKIAQEPGKILGRSFPISARCVRVPVADGHLLSVQVRLRGEPSPEEVAEAFRSHKSAAPDLPSSPVPLFTVHTRRDRPAPRFDAMAGNGMGIAIGRIERCSVMSIKYFVLAHNTIRGAAGAAIANAELLVRTIALD